MAATAAMLLAASCASSLSATDTADALPATIALPSPQRIEVADAEESSTSETTDTTIAPATEGAPQTEGSSGVSPTVVPEPAPPTATIPATTSTIAVTTPATEAAAVEESTSTTATVAAADPNFVGAFDPPLAAVGRNSGQATQIVQLRLVQLGFWHAGADGEYGITTTQAVMAFQKYSALEATGAVDEATAAALTAATVRARGAADAGDLVEIDKQKQLLFIVQGGQTLWVLNTSTGDGLPYEQPDVNSPGEIIRGVSLTPDGLFKVDRERPEGWWEGDLGEIYRPKYFRGGIAVHGSNSVPNYPASHGCVRVSVPAMDYIWEQNLVPMGQTVWVHSG